ncbi:MAG: hypothetical protein HY080_14255 [Gammaproteobacteria bacterium]|nr:hypothetical protein [Gammaproteobacteria bacterium]
MQPRPAYFYSLILTVIIYVPKAQPEPTPGSEFAGVYTQRDVDSQSQIFILDDNTFCFTFMGGALDLIKAGRWKTTTTEGTINLQEVRLNEPIHPALASNMDRLGAPMVGINFDGYSLSNAYSPVFAVTSTDTPPTTFRPLFPKQNSSWAETYALPLMTAEKAKYFFIGDVEVDAYGRPQQKLRVTQYKLDNYDAVRIGFNKTQAEPPMNLHARLIKNMLQLDGAAFGSKKPLSPDLIAEVREHCINPVLGRDKDTSARNKDQAQASEHSEVLTPIKTFYLDATAIAGEPIFAIKDDSATTATDSMEVLIESEANQLQATFKRASSDFQDVDDFLQMARSLAGKKNRIYKHGPLIVQLFSELLIKSNDNHNFKTSEKIFSHFMENIYPAIASIKNNKMLYNISVIASQGLIITVSLKDAAIGKMVFEKLLGTDFDITTHKNRTLIYNLACFHAINTNKKEMLIAITQARKRGIPSKQFMQDPDFKSYLNDTDFLDALK